MKKIFLVVVILIGFLGCSSLPPRDQIGSPDWHADRLKEIEAAYQKGEISKKDYLELKQAADENYVRWKIRHAGPDRFVPPPSHP